MNNPLMMLSLIVIIPFMGMLFTLSSKESSSHFRNNCSNVTIFTLSANICIIWQLFAFLKKTRNMQLIEQFNWLKFPEINLTFAADTASLLMLLAVHIIILGGVIFSRLENVKTKSLMAFTLLFLSMISGLFISNDIFSFFMFFEGMLLPCLMLIGINGNFKKNISLNGFFIYNLIGCMILLVVILWLYQYNGNMTLDQVRKITAKKQWAAFIWSAVTIAFMFRIPIWPFHYFIASINSKIHNSLVFIVLSLLPLSGLYGLYRFWPNYISLEISQYFIWINVIGALTMLFISLIGFSNPDSQYRIFAFITIYYIMYLLGIFSQDKEIFANLGYAIFGFLLIIGSLSVLTAYIYEQGRLNSSISQGFLCRAKRLSLVYSFLIFAAIGFPITAVFTNNFLILSHLMSANIHMGAVMGLALLISALTLISELLKLKTENKECTIGKAEDLPIGQFIFMLVIIFMLLMSFIQPLWFVINS